MLRLFLLHSDLSIPISSTSRATRWRSGRSTSPSSVPSAPPTSPWWDTHTPPLAWNCKCRIRPTDKPVTPIPKETAKDKPAPGLSGNPGRSGSVFDLKSHPYTRNQGDPHCPECRRQGLVKSSDLLDLPGDRLCPMHARALTVKRNIDKHYCPIKVCRKG